MADEIIATGEKVHIMTRGQFSEDLRRHFAGVVLAVSDKTLRAEGYVFVFNPDTNRYIKRIPKRLRLFAIADAGNIINIMPTNVDIESLNYEVIDGRLVFTDGDAFQLDINEFGGRE